MCIYGILWAGLHEKQFPEKAVKRSMIDAGAVGVGIAVQYFLPRYEIINIVLMLLAMECFLHILIGNIQMLAEQKQELELQKAINRSQQSEIMISQIQPHFLYNTLNSI